MRKIRSLAVGMLLLCIFSSVDARAGTNPDILVRAAFNVALGRAPNPKEIDDWKKTVGWDKSYNQQTEDERNNNYYKIITSLKNLIVTPQGEDELMGVIQRSYKRSFARDPKPGEYQYWKNEIYAKRHGYAEMMKYHRLWLQSNKGHADRTYAITQGYLNGIGRAPFPNDLEYWRDKMIKDGSNYTDVLNANINYILQTGNHKEFIATVKRAYAMAKLPEPSGSVITDIRLKIQDKPMAFDQLVEFVKNFKGTTKID